MNTFFNTDSNAEALRTLPINDNIVNRMVCFLDGTTGNEYYEGANADSFDFASTKDWSVSFWINRKNISTSAVILDSRNGAGNDGVAIAIISNNTIRVRIRDSVSDVYMGESDTDVEITGGSWYHLVVVWKGTLTTPVCEFYINGFQSATTIFNQNIALSFTGNLIDPKYGIGYSLTANTLGEIKDLSVWGTALDLDKVRYIYNRNVPNNLNETGWSGFLYHWYRWGDGEGGAGSDSNTQIIDVSRMGIANLLGIGVPVANCPKIASPAFLA